MSTKSKMHPEPNALQTKNTAMQTMNTKGRGFEDGIDKSELTIPRAALMQALSPQISEPTLTPDGKDIRVGNIINSMTNEILPETFIPIFKFTEWVRFNPLDSKSPDFNKDFEPGALIWKTNDPADPRTKEAEFGPNGEKPIATKTLNFFSLFVGHPMPVVVSFSRTSFVAGKKLLSLAAYAGGDMFSRKYKLQTKKVTGEFTYYVLDVAPSGDVLPEEFKQAESLWETFRLKKIEVHSDVKATEIF